MPRAVSAKKTGPWLPQPASATRALHAAGAWEEHTVSSRRAINAAYMAPFRRIVSTRFDLGEAPFSDHAVCCKLGIPTLDDVQAAHRLCSFLVFSNMGLTGFGLSLNLRLGDNGVNVSSWTSSLWPQSSATSLQTWEIHAVNGKDGKHSSLAFLLFGSVS